LIRNHRNDWDFDPLDEDSEDEDNNAEENGEEENEVGPSTIYGKSLSSKCFTNRTKTPLKVCFQCIFNFFY